CRRCEHSIVVGPPSQAQPAAKAAASQATSGPIVPTAASREPRWFVANPDGSYQKLAESEARGLIQAGALSGSTLVWKKGFGEWGPADQTEPWKTLLAAKAAHKDAVAKSRESSAAPIARDSDQMVIGVPVAAMPEPSRRPVAKPQPRPASAAVQSNRPAVVPSSPPSSSSHAAARAIRQTGGALPARKPRKRRKTDRSSAAVGNLQDTAGTIAGAAASNSGSQQAVSLPIVRASEPNVAARRLDPGAGSRGRATQRPPTEAEASRPTPAPQQRPPSGAVQADSPDGGPDGERAGWAPATDTYIGPRHRYTHRIGSEAQRDALLEQVERETTLRRDLRRWQWVALGTACLAIVGFAMAIFSLMHLRNVEKAASACDAPAEAPAEVAPELEDDAPLTDDEPAAAAGDDD
ncbi:MAG: DUF4339 domain-containing protein, partial [Myxococcales bacterium]|nr:DUF4339 domain-containing protein [Myxococcales bacterium]